MKVYLASSWKNKAEVDRVAEELRRFGLEVDNFSDPSSGRFVFSWKDLPAEILENLNAKTFLRDGRTQKAFQEDKDGIDWADVVLMIMPCGRSSHLELGYAKGKGKKAIIYYPNDYILGEFETMYGFADLVTNSLNDIIYQLTVEWSDV
ncbi:MAG: hypothetical protein ACYDHX_08025 [Methanothrix sp.]